MFQTWWETDKNRSAFSGCEKTWQGLKEVQKGKEWYRKHFWECLHCLYHYRILLDENEKVRNVVKKIFFHSTSCYRSHQHQNLKIKSIFPKAFTSDHQICGAIINDSSHLRSKKISFPTIEDQNVTYVKTNHFIKKQVTLMYGGHLHLRHMKKSFKMGH